MDTEQSAILKKAKCLRGLNAYDVFCSEFFKSGMCWFIKHIYIHVGHSFKVPMNSKITTLFFAADERIA